jgi:hypothetical protein
MNFAAAFDYLSRPASQAEDAELSAAEATATRVAEACLSPIAHHPPTPEENGWWGHSGSLLDDAFCLSPEPEMEDDGRAALLTELAQVRVENARLRTTEKQLQLMNAALSTSYQRQKARSDEVVGELERLRDYAAKMETEFERVRDRALDIIVSRTAEVDRLKKELARKKVVLKADAPEFVPQAQTFRDAVIARLREKGYNPHVA